MARFELVRVDVSALDIRRRMQDTDLQADPSEEELRALTDMTFRFVPTAQALEAFAQSIHGAQGLN